MGMPGMGYLEFRFPRTRTMTSLPVPQFPAHHWRDSAYRTSPPQLARPQPFPLALPQSVPPLARPQPFPLARPSAILPPQPPQAHRIHRIPRACWSFPEDTSDFCHYLYNSGSVVEYVRGQIEKGRGKVNGLKRKFSV